MRVEGRVPKGREHTQGQRGQRRGLPSGPRRRGKSKADRLRRQNSRNDVAVISFGFLFPSYVLDLELEKLELWKPHGYRGKNAPTEVCSLWTKDTERGQPSETENFWTIAVLLQVNTAGGNLWFCPQAHQQRPNGGSCFHTQGMQPRTATPHWGVRGALGECGFSSYRARSPNTVRRDHGGPGRHLSLGSYETPLPPLLASEAQ